jgi:hypothetical protein
MTGRRYLRYDGNMLDGVFHIVVRWSQVRYATSATSVTVFVMPLGPFRWVTVLGHSLLFGCCRVLGTITRTDEAHHEWDMCECVSPCDWDEDGFGCVNFCHLGAGHVGRLHRCAEHFDGELAIGSNPLTIHMK